MKLNIIVSDYTCQGIGKSLSFFLVALYLFTGKLQHVLAGDEQHKQHQKHKEAEIDPRFQIAGNGLAENQLNEQSFSKYTNIHGFLGKNVDKSYGAPLFSPIHEINSFSLFIYAASIY